MKGKCQGDILRLRSDHHYSRMITEAGGPIKEYERA
jgi:hypothetical protein